MVVPAVAISTVLGALNGYVLTKWRFAATRSSSACCCSAASSRSRSCSFRWRACWACWASPARSGLVFVHVVYGIGFTTLFFRNYYAAFPTELVRAAQIDGAGFFQIFWRIMLPSSGPIIAVCCIWQFTNIWNDFLFGASFADFGSQPMTVALNNLVQSSTGVKEYNVIWRARSWRRCRRCSSTSSRAVTSCAV